MSRLLKLVLALGLLIALLYFLQMRVAEQPQARIEEPVDVNAIR